MILLELAMQAGLQPKKETAREYSSSCPICGGDDRFKMWPYAPRKLVQGAYWCRQCGISGDSLEFCRRFLNLSWRESKDHLGITQDEPARLLPRNDYRSKRITPVALQTPEWQDKAQQFIVWAHACIMREPEVLERLTKRGIPLEAVQNYMIGFCPALIPSPKKDWGRPIEDKQKPYLWLPRGIVLPTCEPDGRIIRIKIRRENWREDDRWPKYKAISGSSAGLNIINVAEAARGTALIVVESELDAYAIDYAAGDIVMAIAVGSNTKNPDYLSDYLARKAQPLLICHDNDQAGQEMLKKWQSMYPHAQSYPTPMGKDIGEAIQHDFDIKSWIAAAL